ncbi:hypothetical protein [Bacteroides sp. 519]|uniref:hypothetical protein n=1 Tax=Bacteroides sp. 519 TaxID=2302937 RepID=UPI0013D840BD|nr:hypothetical protein [Bacteroides sp. 519]NDV60051.1 hypothetical protein [Bacteroides sp. 519]
MKNDLLKVSIRQNAIFISKDKMVVTKDNLKQTTLILVANLKKIGYTVSEDLLQALNTLAPNQMIAIFNLMKEVLGLNLNWAPLVKGWDTPTGETQWDHLVTLIANIFNSKSGSRLACGHIIPENTFPLERYNGCPFCGTPFQLSEIENYGQGSKLKLLTLWTEDDLATYYQNLLESRTALDATQADSLKILAQELPFPNVEITMKETQVLILDTFVEKKEFVKAQQFITTPTDVLRYLWYKKTGFLQIIEPKTLIKRAQNNDVHIIAHLDNSKKAGIDRKTVLKLKYNRTQCRMVATWLNNLDMDMEKACEAMHPKRGMWVRFIRALRLAEYAQKPGFEYLKELLDVFYNKVYTVYQGEVEVARLKSDVVKTFNLLKQRPGLFARSLFANMLWFGTDQTLAAFEEVMDQVPARLLFTLNMYAETYFDPKAVRIVKPLGGNAKSIGPNNLVNIYTTDQLKEMVSKVEDLCVTAVSNRFGKIETDSKTMYIDPMLFNIPLSIGDRSDTVQDTSSALMGTRFHLEGNAVRLFMQWGKDLPAQHLDMDLSCMIVYQSKTEICAFCNLVTLGAKHSGDIRSIPNKVGTAEYIELDIQALTKENARYVVFTCNAYSNGAISPNLVVGWMNSANPMRISEKTGVAYDPSCVQHQVRVTQSAAKGLVFGVLDVTAREIIWLEMPFGGQVVGNMKFENVEALLAKLKSKTTIGNLLSIKAEAQNLTIVENKEADEVYTLQWAMDTAAVTKLLIE